MYQRKVDVDVLNAIKSVLADVSSVSPSSARYVGQHTLYGVLTKGLMLETSANTFFTTFSISTSTLR